MGIIAWTKNPPKPSLVQRIAVGVPWYLVGNIVGVVLGFALCHYHYAH